MIRNPLGAVLGIGLALSTGAIAQAPCYPVVVHVGCGPTHFGPPIAYLPSPIFLQGCTPVLGEIASPAEKPKLVPDKMPTTPKVQEEKAPDEKKPPLTADVKVPPSDLAKPRPVNVDVKPATGRGDSLVPGQSLPTKPVKDELSGFELTIPIAPVVKPKDDPKPEPAKIPPIELPNYKDKPAAKPGEELPAFDIPLPMAQPVEAEKRSVSKSSPLAAERASTVDVYPVDGAAPSSPTAKRAIGFINKSGRDLLLTIDGRSVILPAKNVLRTDLTATFKWQIGGEQERSESVPMASPGLDIVIRK